MSDDQEAKKDELLALTSIYDEEEFHGVESGNEGEIHLCLELPPDFKLLVKGETLFLKPCSNVVTESCFIHTHCLFIYFFFSGQTSTEYDISFLPPLVLSFELPADYPSVSSPIFTISCKWLTRVQVSPV